MTTKQDKKPVPFIKAGELIKKELKDVYTTYKYGIEDKEYTGWNGGWHACLHIAHSLYDNKFGVENSAKRYAKVTKLAKRLEREFLRKEEKEEDKTIIELYSKNGYVPFISNIEAKKVYKGDFDMFFKLLINGKHINKGYGIYIFEASLTDKIGEFNFELIDFKPLEK